MRRAFSGRVLVAAVLAAASASAAGCHRSGVDAGAGGGGAGGATVASTTGGIDLEPICKSFCVAYQQCAPQTNCKLGCMSSAVLACKQEYADDVVCITENLVNCAGFSVPCADTQAAYQACREQHPPG